MADENAPVKSKTTSVEPNKNEWGVNFNPIFFLGSLLLGFLAMGIYAYKLDDKTGTGIFSELSLLALASLIVGSMLGFLFGMPKTTQASNSDSKKTVYLINTNLEQISDWLTKIIVGLGLIQLKSLPDNIDKIGKVLQKNIGNGKINDIGMVGICIIVYFLLFGFLTLYMYTRINLSSQFLKISIEQDKLANPEVSKPIDALKEDKQPKIKSLKQDTI